MKSNKKRYCGGDGFTIIELLVVISLVTILVSLLLPAVQSVRERSRSVQCLNQLRQQTLALQNFESVYKQFPSDGWGWAWVGNAQSGHGLDSPGGWIHSLLPFLEEQSFWEQTSSEAGRSAAIQLPISTIICPSRREARAYPYTLATIALRNAVTPHFGSRSDYAICAGDRFVFVLPGPLTESDLPKWPIPKKTEFSGISFMRSNIGSRDITDGTSHTLAIAEKLVPIARYENGESLGDDQTALLGDDADIRRWTHFAPLRDGELDDIERFGGPHAAGLSAAYCDGSVTTIGFSIDLRLWHQLGNRADSSVP